MYKLVTSNENKLKEFQRFGLTKVKIEKGKDLKEVRSDPLTIILHKALEAGEGCIVEDTSLHIEGAEVGAQIRWAMNQIQQYKGRNAAWEVLLGVNDGNEIRVYRGTIQGVLDDRFEEPVGFGFDGYFLPHGESKTLYELEQEGRKDNSSARKMAVTKMLRKEMDYSIKIKSIPEWEGEYQ